jgi:hypothetical protein
LPTQSHVSHSKRRNGSDASFGGDDGDFGHVEMCSDLVTFEEFGERQMPNGLTLTGNYVDVILQTETLFFGELDDGVGGEFS